MSKYLLEDVEHSALSIESSAFSVRPWILTFRFIMNTTTLWWKVVLLYVGELPFVTLRYRFAKRTVVEHKQVENANLKKWV